MTTPDSENNEVDHVFPQFLPSGRAVLFTITNTQSIDTSQIAVLDLETGDYEVLIPGGSDPRYAASGHIVCGVAGTLRAVAFDLDSLEVRGVPVPVLEGVVTKGTGGASFSVSPDGTLAYIAGDTAASGGQRTLVWVDRQGQEDSIAAPIRNYTYARVSPDGTQIALDIRDQENAIWIWDVARENLSRLTFGGGLNRAPEWSPDGTRVAFSLSDGDTEKIYWQAADGSGVPELLVAEGPNIQLPQGFTPDGMEMLFTTPATNPHDIGRALLDGEDSVEMLLTTSFDEMNPKVSPDGRWLAFQSDESGENEVYVRPYPEVDSGRVPISVGGGTRPLWAKDGSELFY